MIVEAFIAAEIVGLILSYYGNVHSSLEITRIIEKHISNRDASKLTKALDDYAKGELSDEKLAPMIEDISSDTWNKISENVINLLGNADNNDKSIWTRHLALAQLRNEIVDENIFCTLARAFRDIPSQTLMEAGINRKFDRTRNEMLANYDILKRKFEANGITYSKFTPVYRAFNQIRENVISELNAKEYLKGFL